MSGVDFREAQRRAKVQFDADEAERKDKLGPMWGTGGVLLPGVPAPAVEMLLPIEMPDGSIRTFPVGPDGVIHPHYSSGGPQMHTTQVWCAYYSDFSGIALFGTEIEALRHGSGNSMQCKEVTLGGDLLEQLR